MLADIGRTDSNSCKQHAQRRRPPNGRRPRTRNLELPRVTLAATPRKNRPWLPHRANLECLDSASSRSNGRGREGYPLSPLQGQVGARSKPRETFVAPSSLRVEKHHARRRCCDYQPTPEPLPVNHPRPSPGIVPFVTSATRRERGVQHGIC